MLNHYQLVMLVRQHYQIHALERMQGIDQKLRINQDRSKKETSEVEIA
jgi:hypothetical protein